MKLIMNEIDGYINKKLAPFKRDMRKDFNNRISTVITDEVELINFWSGTPSTIKMSMGLVKDVTNTFYEPGISLGVGDGLGGNRGYITKDTNSLNLYYTGVLLSGEVAGIAIYKDKIECTHKLVVNANLVNEFTIDATNWTAKVTKAQLEDGGNGYAIAKANLHSGVRTSLNNSDSDYYLLNTTRLNGTYIQAAALDASKLNTDQLIMAGATWTNNDPGAGYIKWAGAAIKVNLNGTAYSIAAGNTNLKYIYWTVGNATFTASNTRPTESSTVWMIATNDAGTHSKAYYGKLAAKYITSAFIDDLCVNDAHIANATITSAKIAYLDAAKITTGLLSTQQFTGTGNDYQVLYRQYHIFKENSSGLTKMAMGFAYDPSGTTVPCIVLGAGAANDSSVAKGFITKDTNGLNLFYVSAANAAQGISIKADGIYCTSALKLDVKLTDTYINSASTWVGQMQKLNTSGNFGVNQSGAKRVELTDNIVCKNSSNQKMGLEIDTTYSDMALWYNGSQIFKIYNDFSSIGLYLNTNRIGYGMSSTFYADHTWNFTNATITGLTAVWS